MFFIRLTVQKNMIGSGLSLSMKQIDGPGSGPLGSFWPYNREIKHFVRDLATYIYYTKFSKTADKYAIIFSY